MGLAFLGAGTLVLWIAWLTATRDPRCTVGPGLAVLLPGFLDIPMDAG